MIANSNGYLIEKKDILEILPNRKKDTHKYDYGKVLVIAGSKVMPGAAALSVNAAIKMGAGIVSLATPGIHPPIYPEIIVLSISHKISELRLECYGFLNVYIKGTDAIVIGPGVTRHKDTMNLVRQLVLNNLNKKWIIDGDGLNAFNIADKLNHNVTLTPHFGEFRRLVRDTAKETVSDLDIIAAAKQMECNILFKGPTTIITDGDTTYYNEFGNPGMATAGSGDVLTGIIAANLGKQNQNVFDVNVLKTVALSSAIHSLSADYYADHYDEETLIATEIINNIKNVIKDVRLMNNE